MGSFGSPATATTRPPRAGPMQRHLRASRRPASVKRVCVDICSCRLLSRFSRVIDGLGLDSGDPKLKDGAPNDASFDPPPTRGQESLPTGRLLVFDLGTP